MYWVVQENIRDEASYDSFIAALQELNVQHEIVKVIPFAHEVIPDINPTGRVIVCGSTSLDMVARKKGWEPGTFLNVNFDQRVWSRIYGTDLLNADAEFFNFCKIPSFSGLKFIRPVDDMKVFAGTVIDGAVLDNWKESIQRYSDGYLTLRPDTPVSVSEVKEIENEARFFVVGGKVVTGSYYRMGGRQHQERIESGTLWEFAEWIVDRWQPDNAFVIDIAQVFVQKMFGKALVDKVIEINCINSSGFYQADMRAVVAAIEEL
jgi:hypothetical protein